MKEETLREFLDRMQELHDKGIINLDDYCDPVVDKEISYVDYIIDYKKKIRIKFLNNILKRLK